MKTAAVNKTLWQTRTAGTLLHPSSLPGKLHHLPLPCGTIGREALNFIDFLHNSGLLVWQMLPTSPTHSDRSPYNALSSHAGNPDLICLQSLAEEGWWSTDALLTAAGIDTAPDFAALARLREQAGQWFYSQLDTSYSPELRADFDGFCQAQSHWLDDYCLFFALRKRFHYASWQSWPSPYRQRDPQTLDAARQALQGDMDQARFEQFAWFYQWRKLRQHARANNILLFGDLPIFVAPDSLDVWAAQGQFQLDNEGRAVTVAGVPPDYFSATGQHWGNPHYHWDVMQSDHFLWWQQRLDTQLDRFDLIRIDHFRGLEAYWSIPAGAPDATAGHWVKAPGEALLRTLFNDRPQLPLVAENLGLITDEVEQLRRAFQLPGMYVLQFAFDGNADNINLPHHHEPHNLVYTGTHDNLPIAHWLDTLEPHHRQQLADYMATDHLHYWKLIKLTLASVARMAIVPLQDWLGLDAGARMNTPGTTGGNWQWRFDWSEIPPDLPARIRRELSTYDRLGKAIPFH